MANQDQWCFAWFTPRPDLIPQAALVKAARWAPGLHHPCLVPRRRPGRAKEGPGCCGGLDRSEHGQPDPQVP